MQYLSRKLESSCCETARIEKVNKYAHLEDRLPEYELDGVPDELLVVVPGGHAGEVALGGVLHGAALVALLGRLVRLVVLRAAGDVSSRGRRFPAHLQLLLLLQRFHLLLRLLLLLLCLLVRRHPAASRESSEGQETRLRASSASIWASARGLGFLYTRTRVHLPRKCKDSGALKRSRRGDSHL